ncbi:MAG: FTR1 family protein [Acidobacteria bacterium]|nr:FTR1 family protein [Acidobacteriota bacterium]
MLNAFIIVLREGFEAFLIVAIIFSYLRKTGQRWLTPAVYGAIVVALVASAGLGYWLNQRTEGTNQALWEGIFGLIAIVLVASLIVHMRRIAPKLKQTMHQKLDEATTGRSSPIAFFGVFIFTVLMITREGMETALLLLQIKDQSQLLIGALLGLAAATILALAWARYGHLINIKRFFQVTSLFLVLFLVQVAIYTFHEFTEARILPNSDALHAATEVWSPDGKYGQWFSMSIVVVCIGWLAAAYFTDRSRKSGSASTPSVTIEEAG